jgi:hypothetical protein
LIIILPSIAFSQLEVKMKTGEKVQGKFISETVGTLSLSVFSKKRDEFISTTLDKTEIFSVYDITEDKDVTSKYLSSQVVQQQPDRPSATQETNPPEQSSEYSKDSNTANLQDVVYLKNGSVIRGMIIEQIPNTSLKIQTKDGSVFNYRIDEVQKISKEAAKRDPLTLRSEKSPGLAFVMSFFITGAGQFYNGDVAKGVIQLGGALGGWTLYFAGHRSRWETAASGVFVVLVCSIWSMIDAPIAASVINDEMRQQGYLSLQKAESWSLAFPKGMRNTDFDLTFRISIPF